MTLKTSLQAFPRKRQSFVPVGKTKTQQQFVKDADINRIVRRAESNLILPNQERLNAGQYLDVSNLPDFQVAQNLIIEAQSAFDSFDPLIRRRFNNKPSELIAWLDDPSNADEARTLGILPKLPPVESVTEPDPPSSSPE